MSFEVFLKNVSNNFGGQEKYLQLLSSALTSRGIIWRFSGGPHDLACQLYDNPFVAGLPEVGAPQVTVLNGNRALYEYVFKLKKASHCLYVQHSSAVDEQAGRIKRVLRKFLLRLSLRRVDAVIRVCEAAMPAEWKPDKTFTVHNGVDLRCFPCKTQWVTKPGAITLLMVGAVNSNKGQRLAIRALPALPQCKLIILGKGREREALEAEAASLGVADRVEWAGHRSDPSPYYRCADLCLMLSEFEAMPFVVLESMASGTPVVACKVGGVAEAVKDGLNGILLPNRSSDALVSAVSALASDLPIIERMGREARKTVERRFTVDHMVNGFLSVVDELLKQK